MVAQVDRALLQDAAGGGHGFQHDGQSAVPTQQKGTPQQVQEVIKNQPPQSTPHPPPVAGLQHVSQYRVSGDV